MPFPAFGNLIGDNREATTLCSRPDGFDSDVEREKVGLAGDTIDSPQDCAAVTDSRAGIVLAKADGAVWQRLSKRSDLLI